MYNKYFLIVFNIFNNELVPMKTVRGSFLYIVFVLFRIPDYLGGS